MHIVTAAGTPLQVTFRTLHVAAFRLTLTPRCASNFLTSALPRLVLALGSHVTPTLVVSAAPRVVPDNVGNPRTWLVRCRNICGGRTACNCGTFLQLSVPSHAVANRGALALRSSGVLQHPRIAT